MYQGSRGGETYCPMEVSARVIRSATPRFARQVSSKYIQMGSAAVQRDLRENHSRKISTDYIRKLSGDVGSCAGRAQPWTYALPEQVSDTEVIAIGRDGTTVPVRGEGYREAMSGTVTFYDKEGKRLHTIYVAQSPEYGKAGFDSRMEAEIAEVKSRFARWGVSYVGLADGSADNWTFLERHTDDSILDYWHACEYLGAAAASHSASAYERKVWLEAARERLRDEAGGAASLLKEMEGMRRKRKRATSSNPSNWRRI